MEAMSARRGYQTSFAGLIGAMLVLLPVVAAFVLFRDSVREEPARSVEAVEYLQPAEYARERASFPILVPRELPEGWKVTSVTWTPGDDEAWHLGLLTDEERYVGLEQADELVSTMVRQHVDEDATQGEDVEIDGRTWQRWTDEGGDTALVREGRGVTTLVVATTGLDTLEEFVRTLG